MGQQPRHKPVPHHDTHSPSGVGLTCRSAFQENSMIVYVEKKVLEDPAIVGDDSFGPVKKRFCTFREGERPWGLCQAPAPVPGGRRWP